VSRELYFSVATINTVESQEGLKLIAQILRRDAAGAVRRLHVFVFVKGLCVFPASAPARGKPMFQTPSLHLSIRNFLSLRSSGAVFKELRLVKEMRLEAGDIDGMEGPSRKTTKCLYC
jgi:hypothetical protein